LASDVGRVNFERLAGGPEAEDPFGVADRHLDGAGTFADPSQSQRTTGSPGNL